MPGSTLEPAPAARDGVAELGACGTNQPPKGEENRIAVGSRERADPVGNKDRSTIHAQVGDGMLDICHLAELGRLPRGGLVIRDNRGIQRNRETRGKRTGQIRCERHCLGRRLLRQRRGAGEVDCR